VKIERVLLSMLATTSSLPSGLNDAESAFSPTV
jgi:hypothetical protein